MEFLAILLFLIIIVLLVEQRKKLLSYFERLEYDIRQLKEHLDQERQSAARPAERETKPAPVPVTRPVIETPPAPAKPMAPPTKDPLIYQAGSAPPAAPGPQPSSPVQRMAPPPPPSPAPPKPAAQKPPPEKKGFFELHPDLEKFIGENLVSKIGIAILVLAIGFFVKYAIDNDWIGPVGRVGIGLLCGGILVGIAHWLRKGYAAFSSVLVGGGIAIFYFTIALAYHQYGLFNQSTSFVIMLVITAFAVLLSLLYDRQELAIIALVGGFAAPFMVSDGSGNYKVLFSYLLILNTGLLVIAYHKAWRLLNLLAFLFTSVLFISWLAMLPSTTSNSDYGGGFLFATAFYILFFVINIAYTIRGKKKFIASDFGILLGNTCFYFAMGLWLLSEMSLYKYRGLFSASMGIFNLGGTYFLLRTKKVDSNILYLLIGITLSFVSLTAPLQLHGHFITLFWATEAVLLYWLSQRSGIRVIRWASLLIWGAMLMSLMMDWSDIYGDGWLIHYQKGNYLHEIIFNKGFMTGLYSALSCYALFFFLRREKKDKPMQESAAKSGSEDLNLLRIAFLLVGSLVLFATGALEINYQFTARYPDSELNTLYLLLYTFAFVSLLTFLADRRNWFGNPWTAAGLLVACIVIYLFFIPDNFSVQRDLLEGAHYRQHFIAHWVSALLIASILYRLIAGKSSGRSLIDPTLFTWIVCILVISFLSSEIQLLVNAFFYSKAHPLPEIQRVYYQTGLPILWGLCSFSFMWLGMRRKFKPLRILSLVLFSVTLLKLFLFDIRNIPIAGKIAAFFCLGVLLLVVSFMYQRLKKIIVEDEEKKVL